jgi:hypothetical protein
MIDENLKQKVEQYGQHRGIRILEYLGGGTDGHVWHSGRDTAVKAFHREKNYLMELQCYQRLREHNVVKIEQFAVPRLVWHDIDLLVIEMSMVSPPCLIDFSKAYLDGEPHHTPEVLADAAQNQRYIWGDRYAEVMSLIGTLKYKYGIYHQDPNARNIWFEGETFTDLSDIG